MKFKDLKAYHAYYVMVVIWLLTCVFTGSFVYFPIACAFLCIAMVSKAKEEGRIETPKKKR